MNAPEKIWVEYRDLALLAKPIHPTKAESFTPYIRADLAGIVYTDEELAAITGAIHTARCRSYHHADISALEKCNAETARREEAGT